MFLKTRALKRESLPMCKVILNIKFFFDNLKKNILNMMDTY